MVKIGIIGGSGLYKIEQVQDQHDLDAVTRYGKPSSPLRVGKVAGTEVVFIARHGREHTIPPTQVNYKANIQALKDIGCTHILATTACGSLRKEIGRGHLVILDQFIDFTRRRDLTFYDSFSPGEHGHTPMATPFSEELRNAFITSCQELGLEHHRKGTVVTIEGPRFSTKAESKMFASWGADVINMSIAPECALANEAKIPYAAVAMSTDYDCLFDDVAPVTHEEVLAVFTKNVGKVIKLLMQTIPKVTKISFTAAGKNLAQEEEDEEEEYDLKTVIRTVPHWPKKGVMFKDITTLLENPEAFAYCIARFKEQFQDKKITKVAGIESRGFIFGAALAKELHLPFVLIRKKGKLPAETVAVEYDLEYGTDKIEIHKSSLHEMDKVLIVDDLLATGGTLEAACKLVEKLNATVAGLAVVINLPDLQGSKKLEKYNLFHLVEYEGD